MNHSGVGIGERGEDRGDDTAGDGNQRVGTHERLRNLEELGEEAKRRFLERREEEEVRLSEKISADRQTFRLGEMTATCTGAMEYWFWMKNWREDQQARSKESEKRTEKGKSVSVRP
jgi:hypothetical protein